MKITVRDVARKAETSIATVSRFLNQSGYVSKDVAGRIQEAIDGLGYEPKGLARIFLGKSQRNVAILIPDLLNLFYPSVIMGLEDALESHGYSSFLCITYDSVDKEVSYLKTLMEKNVDAFIFVGARQADADTAHIAALTSSYPVLLLNDYLLGVSAYSVMSDEVDGAYSAVRYLQSLGHRRIGFANGAEEQTTFKLKENGYRLAIEESGAVLDEHLLVAARPDEAGGHQAASSLLALENRPTAIFCASDQMAIGVLRAAAEVGMNVPKDLSVVGFSNLPLSAELHPPLTTMDQKPYDLGRLAADTVVGVLGGENISQRRILVQPTLCERSTCAKI